MEVAFANARTLVEPAETSKTLLPIADMKPHGKFVQGQVRMSWRSMFQPCYNQLGSQCWIFTECQSSL